MGERRRVAIARALLAAPALLALDEPTNHLDAATTAWLEDRLCDRDGALLLVTHDRYFLDRVATRIVELDRGRIYTHDGGYREMLARQAERWATEDEQRQKRAALVRSELGWIRRRAPARTTKQKARIDRFEATVAEQQTDIARSPGATLRLGSGGRLGGTIVELLDLVKRTPDGRTLIAGLTLRWKHGDRIGVVGPNGAGKTTLIRTILGELAPEGGRVVVGQNTRFGFMDQARTTLDDAKTVLEEIAGDTDRIELVDGSVHVRTFLRMLLFEDAFADAKVGVLSGGERNRVQLAKLLRSAGNFLILDEPTNDLDVLTLGVLEDALAQFSGCALIVSHDRWFLDKVATGILAFEGDGNVTFYEGSCSDYLARRSPTPASEPEPERVAATRSATKPRRRSFHEQRELAGIEAAIGAAEVQVAERELELADPELYAKRGADVPGLVVALDAARAEVDRLYARWQELDAIPE
jgi:ATP-binding cassette subfamily F protein uup